MFEEPLHLVGPKIVERQPRHNGVVARPGGQRTDVAFVHHDARAQALEHGLLRDALPQHGAEGRADFPQVQVPVPVHALHDRHSDRARAGADFQDAVIASDVLGNLFGHASRKEQAARRERAGVAEIFDALPDERDRTVVAHLTPLPEHCQARPRV